MFRAEAEYVAMAVATQEEHFKHNIMREVNMKPAVLLASKVLVMAFTNERKELGELDISISASCSSEKPFEKQQVRVEECLSAGSPAACLMKFLGVGAPREMSLRREKALCRFEQIRACGVVFDMSSMSDQGGVSGR